MARHGMVFKGFLEPPAWTGFGGRDSLVWAWNSLGWRPWKSVRSLLLSRSCLLSLASGDSESDLMEDIAWS